LVMPKPMVLVTVEQCIDKLIPVAQKVWSLKTGKNLALDDMVKIYDAMTEVRQKAAAVGIGVKRS